jgi:SpoVK/Ycf46/Vps4 family AAA+-type ATPase
MMIKTNSIDYFKSKLDQITSLVYVLTEDEHRVILNIEKISASNKYTTEIFIYKSTTGIVNIQSYKKEIDEKKCLADAATVDIHNALIHIHQQNKKDRRQIFIITEADQHLEDAQVLRRVKDFAIQADSSDSNLKVVILMSSKLFLPDKLEKYIDVFTYPYPDDEEIRFELVSLVAKFNNALKDKSKSIEVRTDFEVINSLKGLIIPQIHQVITSCIDITRKQNKHGKGCLDPTIINTLKRTAISKTSLLKFKEPEVTFKTVGGLGRLKKWFRKMYGGWTNEGKEFGLPPLKGVILVGLPGCGKSLICEALASEWGLNFIQFDPSKVFSSRVGESEGNMHLVLARAESLAPSIMFIDEIEKGFAGSQSSSFSDAGTTLRTIGIFLIWMNDNKSFTFVAATCNQIHILPPELVSRFDGIFFVGPPDLNERKEIIDIHLKQNNRDPKKFNLDELAGCCPNLAGREIMQATHESLYEAFSLYKNDKKSDLTQAMLKNSLRMKVPIVKTMEKQLEYLVKWVGYDKERNEGIRARFANNETDEIDELFKEVLSKVADDKSEGLMPKGL